MKTQVRFCQEQWRSGLRFALVVVLCACSHAAFGLELSNSFVGRDTPVKAGLWWNEDQSGWNLAVHFAGEQMIVVWSTYDDAGEAIWYMGQATESNGVWNIPLRQHSWDVAENKHAGSVSVGSLSLTFNGEFNGIFAWELGPASGVTSIEPFVLTERLTDADRTGLWFEPRNPGYGLAVQTQGAWDLTMVYYYDETGRATWALGHNGGERATQILELTTFTGACPNCTSKPAIPASATGELRRVFTGPASARVDLTIDSSDHSWAVSDTDMALLSESTSSRPHAAALVPFRSESALLSFMSEGLTGRGCYVCSEVDFSASPGLQAPRASTTNLQEAGVDEADEVKSDGEFLYLVKPAEDESGQHVLRVMELIDGDSQEISTVAFGQQTFAEFGGLYLVKADDENEPDLLVAMRSGYGGGFTEDLIWPGPWSWISSTTELFVFDVSDPAQPLPLAEIELDGGLFTTRRVEQTLYAILRFTPGLPPEDEQLGEDDARLLMPRVSINGEDRGPILSFEDALLPPQPEGGRYADMVLFVPIDLDNLLAKPVALGVVGQSEAIYFSPQSGYLATTRYHYPVNFAVMAIAYPPRIETDIHKFGIDATNVSYQGTGTVEGHLGWGFNERSFRMGEFGDDLRVVSSSQTMWQDHEHRVTVLRQNDEQVLEEISRLPNDLRPERIGKPGELLFSTRFMGDRLYAVSFRNIDPLYVVDLADPADPFIAGELEITGFSEYLHVLPNNLLLGFGKNASPAMVSGDGGTFSWFQGLQLSLFDVSDPANLSLVQRTDIGRRGSDSPLLYDHHAFSILPGDPALDRPAMVAIPVSVHDAKTPDGVMEDPQFYYEWQYSGLAMFEIGEGSPPGVEVSPAPPRYMTELTPLITHRAEAGDNRPWDQQPRSVLLEDTAYFVSEGEVWSSPWGQGDQYLGPR